MPDRSQTSAAWFADTAVVPGSVQTRSGTRSGSVQKRRFPWWPGIAPYEGYNYFDIRTVRASEVIAVALRASPTPGVSISLAVDSSIHKINSLPCPGVLAGSNLAVSPILDST